MSKDKKILTKDEREKVVKSQAGLLIELVDKELELNSQILETSQRDGLVKKLYEKVLAIKFDDGRKLKPDSIKIALDYFKGNPDLVKALNKALDRRKVGGIKQSEHFEKNGKKLKV